MPQSLSFFLLLPLSSLFFFSNTSHGNSLASNCPSNECGGVKINYPFWLSSDATSYGQYCGYPGFNLTCSDDRNTIFNLPGESFYVKNISYSDYTLTLVDVEVSGQTCPRARQNVTIQTILPQLSYNSTLDLNLSFYYNCSGLGTGVLPIPCLSSGENESYVFVVGKEPEGSDFDNWYNFCEDKVVVTVMESEINDQSTNGLVWGFEEAVKDGFVLNWRRAAAWCRACEASVGRCGFNIVDEDYLLSLVSITFLLFSFGYPSLSTLLTIILISTNPILTILTKPYLPHPPTSPSLDMHSPSSVAAAAATTITAILLILVSVAFSPCYSQEDELYYTCVHNFNFSCGQAIQNVSYPFWGGDRHRLCGHPSFELKCRNNEYPTIEIDNRDFRVLRIDQSKNTMTLASLDLWESYCTQELHNITLDDKLFTYGQTNRVLFLFYNCTSEATTIEIPPTFPCEIGGVESHGIYADETLFNAFKNNLSTSCTKSVEVQVFRETLDKLLVPEKSLTLQEVLHGGFEVEYDVDKAGCARCEVSGGICGSNLSEFACHCRDRTDPATCQNTGNGRDVGRKLIIGFGASGGTLLIMGVLFFLHQRRNKKRYDTPSWIPRNISSFPSSATDPEQAGAIYGVHIFKYSELEKATGNFNSEKELGDGGFGTVYQGKLKDGRDVAVKRLYEHNFKRMEQFMNEVEILARLRHINLVSLYGCTSRHCRELLLVYEYVPNGTVADHLHGDRAKPGSLSWTTRLSIAVETANALTYLHHSDVIHRDVKTNNILLDNNFCVKVADFGLSRLFPTNVTHVSTAPQGTPGYVDPEYHECYQLTDKSDVYSFGVVLIELISSKPAVDITRHRHEINLSAMAMNKIQNHALHELIDPYLGFETDFKAREMISEVAELAFQCLQSERDMRPSMEKVLETLKGIQSEDWNLRKPEEIEIPSDELVLLKSDPPTLSPDSLAKSSIARGSNSR
ncbi:hypothetical protein RHGRI_034671 [Rhododendron griersonianum]|uniref:non-specific serine/threonine protein kinase n=2 Tax=Rhododendron griersonianum TaxID=479676 RepID=A0AAV6I213_9ERIC|nr:hypothetical protein RHGRI_034671 [Rhododendron griersonianum]